MDSTTHHSTRHRWVRFVTGIATLFAVLVGASATASAGGWAVTTLDNTPAPVPGEPVDVGFTIRQHGVTPVDLDDVSIEVVAADGAVTRFAAAQQGETGHYVATVTLPEAGTYTWIVNQGWFSPQDLGQLTVAPAAAKAAPEATSLATPEPSTQAAAVARVVETSHTYPAVARYGLPALALVFGAMAVADIVMRRRRREATVAA